MTQITIQATINQPISTIWTLWTQPEHITQWNAASPDWHCPTTTNDLRVGGSFTYRMEAKDGSVGFDFGGIYDEVETHEKIAYTMEDGRRAMVTFEEGSEGVTITIVFDAEDENPVEMQREGWQAILDNFKKYAESQS